MLSCRLIAHLITDDCLEVTERASVTVSDNIFQLPLTTSVAVIQLSPIDLNTLRQNTRNEAENYLLITPACYIIGSVVHINAVTCYQLNSVFIVLLILRIASIKRNKQRMTQVFIFQHPCRESESVFKRDARGKKLCFIRITNCF